jgi:phosphoribosylformylglycinamidine cyclo-ligase
MYRLTGACRYDLIAKDTVAMAVNDLVSVGAEPLVVHAYWGTSGSGWFDDEKRAAALVRGWKAACDESGAAWGGGETPVLSGIVVDGASDLAASCVGIDNGMTYGDALLEPTSLYARAVRAMFEAGVGIKYMSNITGHGWRKIMRHPSDFVYRIGTLPPVPPVLEFIARHAGLDRREAYGTFNMGAGFAVYCPRKDAENAVAACAAVGIDAWNVGTVEKGKRSVVIGPLNLVFEGESLKLRT